MPDYLVRFHQPQQGVQLKRVTAPQPQAVAQVLAVSPLQVLSVQPLDDAADGAVARRRAARGFALRPFCQELAVLLDAGIPLLEALTTLQKNKAAARPLPACWTG